jgi:hypothetical protein
LVSRANDPNALPRLQNLAFIDTPLLSVQELVLLREMAGQPVCELSLHFSNSFFGDFHSLRSSSSMTWLTDHTRWFFLTEGDQFRGFLCRSNLPTIGVDFFQHPVSL